ncbi:disease resistance protein At4g27190-like [Vigna unguiculata]|uniref:Disease resistance protein RPS2 n=1 Tax=Vigna unguiculata TaxID=3917 RepID=A0A4D6L7P7_VIGUN|nr:disease resistance protein At4g27190-like [Vigna unguiculata]XP_027919427.1 disease resistance protein At4g27190-like [Vigna unguiculata]QCD84549.1 disease resistance protein RPS2 [Vigna unguiculata]
MSGLEPFVSPLVGAVGTIGIGEVRNTLASKFAFSKNLDDNYHILVKDTEMLQAIMKDKEIEAQRNHHRDTSNAYKLWTNKVSNVTEEVQELKLKYEIKTLPRWRIQKRSRMSEEMEKKSNWIRQLINDGCLKNFLVDKPPEPVLKELNVPQISGYPTLQGTLDNILDLLKNNKIKIIGVCGTKGVGKTTIMRNLNNNEEIAKLFEIVIFVKVTSNDHKLQEKIAHRLMLYKGTTNNEDSDDVARRIYRELDNKRYLLILDEVEDAINLELLGIPSNGSKVVIVTRFPRVYKLNRVQRVINVEKLSLDEAWKMFRDTVHAFNPKIDSPDIQLPAKLVCKRCCCGLPLLIYNIANSFRLKESASSWWAGLEDLKPWPELQSQGLEELYSCLKFCYDELNDKRKQKCFLYTSMYPADSKVYSDYLVECWAAQGLLGDINDERSYQSARNRGIDILEHLANVSLLEKGEAMIYVNMNHCMRQLALHISSKDPECSFYLQDGEESENLSNSRAWQQARWVSMGQVHDLRTSQDCSTILTLLLRKIPELPESFFENMSSLLLLDLYSSMITQLPSSLSKLTGLRGLFLNRCELLESLSSEIGLLQFLEVLDIRDTKVTFIPLQIGFLTKLRCLRIPFIASEDNQVQNVHAISKLHRLEELTIQVISYEQWCNHAENVLQHVASLENVTHLRCCFPSSTILGEFLSRSKSWHKKQSSFRFTVGCQNSRRPQILESFEYKITNYLRYCNGGQKDDPAIIEVLPKTDAFELVCHKDMKKISNFAGIACLERIRGLLIKRCNQVLTIVSGETSSNAMNGIQIETTVILPNLEQLYLENLLNLKCAFRGPLHSGTFSRLQALSLKNCPRLSQIFSNGAIQHFSELQKLKLEDCSKIEELIGEDIERERDVLPKLEILLLVNLPNLKNICATHTLAWSSLELLRIHNCPMFKTLPLDSTNAVNLKSIKGQQEWWTNLDWTNNDKVHKRFQPIFVASNEYFS